MKYTTLDKIVKGYLLQKRYPIHFYVDFLVYAARCFQEIHFDTLGNVRTVKLSINSYAAVTLPNDYMDWCKIGVANGAFVKPLHQRDSMNRLNNTETVTSNSSFDTTFDTSFIEDDTVNKILYPEQFNGYGSEYWYYRNYPGYTDYGGSIDYADGFKVLPERNEIQLQGRIYANDIILEYISDGSEVDNATQINPYATATMEAYINWKLKENSRSYSDGERMIAQREFDHQHRILRARMNPLTISDIKSIIYRNSTGAPK